MSSSIFHDLLSKYTTWSALSEYLLSEEGGFLRIYDQSKPENPFALIRYVKGKSTMTLPHVRAFRSVVWDTLENRPVSVTPFKSMDGESLPSTESTAGFTLERFLDGVMIGAFYDRYTSQWRIHTRSTLDATSRYYSQDRTFAQMFDDFKAATNFRWEDLDKNSCYTWILQHPENRVVTPITKVMATLVQKASLTDNVLTLDKSATESLQIQSPMPTWTDVLTRLADWNVRFKHTVQGIVVKEDATGNRWKVRTSEYNRVRQLRTNTPRRDFLWLSLWRSNGLRDYLTIYPEERLLSNVVINKWKRITNDVFHIYTDVFKARSLDKKKVLPKYRPFVFGIHSLFMENLKPAGKTVVWKTVLDYMNGRDVAQMLFAINWDVRQAARLSGAPAIPFEPSTSIGTEVLTTEPSANPQVIFRQEVETDEDMPDLIPIADSMVLLQATMPPPGGDV